MAIINNNKGYIMKNAKTFAIALVSGISICSVAQAKFNCQEVNYTFMPGNGVISQAACPASVLGSLSGSNLYPEIFSSTPARILGICFLSDAPISAAIGTTQVKASTGSAYTSEIVPGAGGLATVATEWAISDAHTNKILGSVYTHDTINLSTGVELDVIVGGSGLYKGAHGAFTVQSIPVPPYDGTAFQVASITGPICFPTDR